MRSIDLALPFNRLARMFASFSVRTRIVVLALVPVAGFLANGVTYVSGEGDVGRSFATVTQSHALADSSRDFKSAVASMRIIVKDFSVNPDNNLVVSFEQTHANSVKDVDAIVASIAAASIVAKVTRDRLMAQLGLAHPGYGFERHMGYSVPEHFAALLRLGPTIHHRRTFAPVAARYDSLGPHPQEIPPGLLPPDLSA